MGSIVRLIALIPLCVAVALPGAPALAQTDNAQCVGDTIPTTMTPGLQYSVSVTFKNTGTSTWTNAAGYRLGAAGDSDPLSGPGRVDLGGSESIGPNQQKTFNFTLTAPLTAGVYTTDWRMVREGVSWFGETLVREVDVSWGLEPPDAPVVTLPLAGSAAGSNRPDIAWTGGLCDAYEVRISSYNSPDGADGWSSGVLPVSSAVYSTTSGPLVPGKTYFVFVRLRNLNGWSPWSAPYRSFYVAGEFLNDPYQVTGAYGYRRAHQLCYNPDRNEYLVGYFCAGTYGRDVSAFYRLDANANMIGSEGVCIDDMAGAGGPHIAYNSARQEYLLSYGGYTAEPRHELHLQRVNAATGATIGASTRVNTPEPVRNDIAYSTVSDRYLLAFEDGGRIFGVILDSTAAPISSIFRIDNGSQVYCGTPRIAYNSTNNEYLVVWVVNTNYTWDAYAQRVRASDGVLLGSNITIGNGPETEFPGGVAWDNDMNRYLVICDGENPGSPWGQFISSTGALQGGRFLIGGGYFGGGMSGICWNPINKEYLATWAHAISDGNFGRRISQTGTLIGEPFRTNGYATGFGNWDPVPVVNTVNNEFLICWQWQHANVYVRRYRALPLPAADTTAPAAVSNFTAAASGNRVTLSWTNPSDADFAGTIIKFSTTGYPSGPSSGTLVADRPGLPGSADTFVHDKLNGGTTYYYSAFARDEVPNYSAARSALATPLITSEMMISNSTFDGGPDGWTTLVWRANPSLEFGKMEWNDKGNPGGCMRAAGVGQTDSSDRCTREGGEIWKVISTLGYQGIRVYYDLKVNALGGDYTGSGTGGCAVDHNLIDEQLTIYYSTNGGTSWIDAGYLRRSELLAGYLNNYGTRMLDLSGVEDVNSNPNFALRFRWQFNSFVDAGYLDNITVTGGLRSLAALRGLPNSAPVSFEGKGLYLKRSTFAYIEEPDRSSGIRIKGSIPGNEGDRVSIRGSMQTEAAGGERFVQVGAMTLHGQLGIAPLGMNNRDLNAGMAEGLFVRTWGLVKAGSITSNSFVLTDGSDDTGIRVITPGAPGVSADDYVSASGAAGIINGVRVLYRR